MIGTLSGVRCLHKELMSVSAIKVVKKLIRVYDVLKLSRPKMAVAVILMLVTSILEMAGVSILYPLIMAIQGKENSWILKIFNVLPFSVTITGQIIGLFLLVAVTYLVKNILLYFTYQNNIKFSAPLVGTMIK